MYIFHPKRDSVAIGIPPRRQGGEQNYQYLEGCKISDTFLVGYACDASKQRAGHWGTSFLHFIFLGSQTHLTYRTSTSSHPHILTTSQCKEALLIHPAFNLIFDLFSMYIWRDKPSPLVLFPSSSRATKPISDRANLLYLHVGWLWRCYRYCSMAATGAGCLGTIAPWKLVCDWLRRTITWFLTSMTEPCSNTILRQSYKNSILDWMALNSS